MIALAPNMIAALTYADHGDAVFPVWWADDSRCACGVPECLSPAKHPIAACAPHGFQDATRDTVIIQKWWTRFPEANIAIPTGARRAVLDVDPDKGGRTSLAALEAKYGLLPVTATTVTGGGGEHRHYAPVSGLRNSVGVIAPGLDIRAEGGYVLVPPSNHVSGGEYADDALAPLYETPLAPMPAWLVALAAGNGNGNRVAVEPPSFTVPATISDGTRNDTLYRLARSLKAKGLSLRAISSALDAENLARCVPPLSPREMRSLLEHAWTQPDRPEFSSRPDTTASPGDTAAPSIIEVIDAADLVARAFPEEPALVGGGLIVPRSLNVTSGPPKRGKSLFVLNREIRRAHGQPFLGFATTPGRTLYIQAEIPEANLKERFVAMLKGEGLEAEGLRDHIKTVTRRGLFVDEPAGFETVRRLIEQTEPDLVSLDPLARFFVGEENSAREMGRLINALDRLIQEYKIAVELVHHTGKPVHGDPRQGGHRLRGSSALFGAADAVVILDRTQDAWLLSFELRHAEEPAPMPLTRTANLWFTLAGPPEKLVAVASIVKDIPLRFTALVGAIVSEMKCSERTAERMVRDTKKAGLIWQGDNGLYRQAAKRRHSDDDGDGSTE
jgi:Bifunctional DNA primase/polymerase, N-terminal/AAA domain/Primase C terminal 1 (PriCT-1)